MLLVRAPTQNITSTPTHISTTQQEQTPSYLPSYTRLGHAIPGSKTVSVGGVHEVCFLVMVLARAHEYTHQ